MSLARGVKICNRFTKPKGILSILEWLSKLLSSWDRAKRTHFNWQRWSTGPPFRFNYAALVLCKRPARQKLNQDWRQATMKVERREMADEVYNLNPPTYMCVGVRLLYFCKPSSDHVWDPRRKRRRTCSDRMAAGSVGCHGGVNHNCHQERAKYPLDHQGPCDAEAEPKIQGNNTITFPYQVWLVPLRGRLEV